MQSSWYYQKEVQKDGDKTESCKAGLGVKDTKIRLQTIEKLKEIHPAVLNSRNPKIATYTGGMVDSGDLNWEYCLFKATIEELKEALR